MNDLDILRRTVTTTTNQIGRHWRRLAHDIVVAHGVSDAAALPLITMSRLGDGVRQGALAEAVGLEGPSLVRVLDQLCADGLVERREDPLDRRARMLFLTREGRRVTTLIEQELIRLRAQVLGGVSREDLEATLRVFQVIEEAAARAEAPSVPVGAEP
ncbi:MarR family winged helix-turn-helix transcriptional regulator [Labrys monachus]|uniref:MarR family transcriptional regulator for hemolysin n=1 Tax=Labrys monachus TaxID=217067 RepID=A0ABU0FK48_9HYPH|nr:MarR family transcriptional regulator [Labrys monachus]MDQ0394861.1 MarR family transcriptional regulator for hemolysin [Labrys monachus]